eukprot:TRINITY_DN3396_c2_g1_i1.p1 TRINITY_DN3396_c2_g1~~TRINITY_DN3396_c2_g1_i1.p1  ORF type:complete len:282 (+),score=97.33 TRINITY_DN3396_c2_g1_i1:33-848(+)
MSVERVRFHEIVGQLPPKRQDVRVERMDVAAQKMQQERGRLLKDLQRRMEFEEKHYAQVEAVRLKATQRSKRKQDKYLAADHKAGDRWNTLMDERSGKNDALDGKMAYTLENKYSHDRTVSGTARVVNALKKRALQEGKTLYQDQALEVRDRLMDKLGHKLPNSQPPHAATLSRPRIKGCPYQVSPRSRTPVSPHAFNELCSTQAALRPLQLTDRRSCSPEGTKGRGVLTQSAVDAAVTWLRYKRHEGAPPVHHGAPPQGPHGMAPQQQLL